MERTARIYGINGPLVTVKGQTDLRMGEMVYVGEEKLVGEGVAFERVRRITGYLVGTLDRFNNAKRAEEHDRVKHA